MSTVNLKLKVHSTYYCLLESMQEYGYSTDDMPTSETQIRELFRLSDVDHQLKSWINARIHHEKHLRMIRNLCAKVLTEVYPVHLGSDVCVELGIKAPELPGGLLGMYHR